jgi:hypothetical protein
MRPAWYVPCVFVLAVSLRAQTPSNNPTRNPSGQATPQPNSNASDSLQTLASEAQQQIVPLSQEPHHLLVLQNDFTRVYNVSVAPLDATLPHQHDLPYVAVSLGPASVANVVVGKPAARLVLQDGQVTYSAGAFAHLVRTDSGIPFHNVTVELVKPQGTARNLCESIVPGPLRACPQRTETADRRKNVPEAADDDVPYFETDGARVDLFKVSMGKDYVEESPKLNGLLIALSNANLDVNLGGQHISFLHDGDILWMPAGTHRRVADFLGTRSNFLLVTFKDSAGSAQP